MAGVIAIVRSVGRAMGIGGPTLEIQADPGGGDDRTFTQYGPSGDDSSPLDGDSIGGLPVQGTGRVVATGYADTKNVGIAEQGEVRRYAREAETGEIVGSWHLKKDGSFVVENRNGQFRLGADGSFIVENSAGSFELTAAGAVKGQNGAGSFELTAAGALNAIIKTFRVANDVGSLSMDEAGEVDMNGVTVPVSGDVNVPGTVTADVDVVGGGKSLATHVHVGSPTAPDGAVSDTGAPV